MSGVTFFKRLRQFFRENPAAILFVNFQVLLVASAILMVSGLSSYAEGTAVVAYFLLTAGVLVQLALLFRRGSKGE